MANTILRRTKILYDDDHFVRVALIESDGWYAVVVQIDEIAVGTCASEDDYDRALDFYHDCLIDIFSMTFEELMEESGIAEPEDAKTVYEEMLDELDLSKEMFGRKKPSELFNAMQDVSRVEMVMKHSTFSKLING